MAGLISARLQSFLNATLKELLKLVYAYQSYPHRRNHHREQSHPIFETPGPAMDWFLPAFGNHYNADFWEMP